jgi:hypothetical protein
MIGVPARENSAMPGRDASTSQVKVTADSSCWLWPETETQSGSEEVKGRATCREA